MIANTPEPPYYVVIFSSILTKEDENYFIKGKELIELAQRQDGFLGIESARNDIGITVSYWRDLDSIKKWKENTEHSLARKQGKREWYSEFKLRIARVERDYEFKK